MSDELTDFRLALEAREELQLGRLLELSARIDLVEAELMRKPPVRGGGSTHLPALETRVAEQAAAMRELEAHAARTDGSLLLVVESVDRLAAELTRRHAAASTAASLPSAPRFFEDAPEPKSEYKKLIWTSAAIVLLAVVTVFAWQFWPAASGPAPVAKQYEPAPVAALDQAKIYVNAREYAKAEAIYRDLLTKNPKDPELVRGLAGVLFREEKIEESAAVLKTLSGEAP